MAADGSAVYSGDSTVLRLAGNLGVPRGRASAMGRQCCRRGSMPGRDWQEVGKTAVLSTADRVNLLALLPKGHDVDLSISSVLLVPYSIGIPLVIMYACDDADCLGQSASPRDSTMSVTWILHWRAVTRALARRSARQQRADPPKPPQFHGISDVLALPCLIFRAVSVTRTLVRRRASQRHGDRPQTSLIPRRQHRACSPVFDLPRGRQIELWLAAVHGSDT
jgi:hypothetical protein